MQLFCKSFPPLLRFIPAIILSIWGKCKFFVLAVHSKI